MNFEDSPAALEPPPDPASVLLPGSTMGTRQPWLLAEYHTQVEGAADHSRIGEQANRAERDGPTQQDDEHAHVHGIAAVAVQADDHQRLRRSPRSKRALARYVEVSDAPQQTEGAECDHGQTVRPAECLTRKPQPCARHQVRNDAWQRDKRNDSSRKDGL